MISLQTTTSAGLRHQISHAQYTAVETLDWPTLLHGPCMLGNKSGFCSRVAKVLGTHLVLPLLVWQSRSLHACCRLPLQHTIGF